MFKLEAWSMGIKSYDEKDYEHALWLFSRMPDSSQILTNMGLIYATIGRHKDAVEKFAAATKLDQYSAVAYFQSGVSNFLIDRHELALKDFEDALFCMRGNKAINYKQLGLQFKLFSAEVLFNKGLVHIQMGRTYEGLMDMEAASREKVTPAHDIIDEAIVDCGQGYIVFSIPVGILYQPSENKLRNLEARDYVGKAKPVPGSQTTITAVLPVGNDYPGRSTSDRHSSKSPRGLKRHATDSFNHISVRTMSTHESRYSYNSKTSSLTSLDHFYYIPPDQAPYTRSPCPSSIQVVEIDGSAPSSRRLSTGATNILSLPQPPDPSDAAEPSPGPSDPISWPTLPSPGKPVMGNPPPIPMRSPHRPKAFTSLSRINVVLLDGTSSPDSVSTHESSDTSETKVGEYEAYKNILFALSPLPARTSPMPVDGGAPFRRFESARLTRRRATKSMALTAKASVPDIYYGRQYTETVPRPWPPAVKPLVPVAKPDKPTNKRMSDIVLHRMLSFEGTVARHTVARPSGTHALAKPLLSAKSPARPAPHMNKSAVSLNSMLELSYAASLKSAAHVGAHPIDNRSARRSSRFAKSLTWTPIAVRVG